MTDCKQFFHDDFVWKIGYHDAAMMREELIAPCGMNCGICSGYLAYRVDSTSKGVKMSYCSGCRPRGKNCAFLKKGCERLTHGTVQYCYECDEFPCLRLKQLDKRYRAKYHMSMIENLEYIRDHGTEQFLEWQREKWRCPECGGVVCCHNGICYDCGLDKLKERGQKYRWEET